MKTQVNKHSHGSGGLKPLSLVLADAFQEDPVISAADHGLHIDRCSVFSLKQYWKSDNQPDDEIRIIMKPNEIEQWLSSNIINLLNISTMRRFIILLVLGTMCQFVAAQSWNALYGGNQRNNYSPHYGLKEVQTPLWTVNNAAETGWGGNIYTFGDRFVTTRWDFYGENNSVVECRSLHTGQLLWVFPDYASDNQMQVIAFNEDAVYVYDYVCDGLSYYALDPSNGEVKWTVPGFAFGMLDSPIFDCERNLVINCTMEEPCVLRSVDKHTGATRWVIYDYVWVYPYGLKAAYGNTLYMITGTGNETKRLAAYDLSTGFKLYESDPIPGRVSQNAHHFIGHDGTIYIFREDDDLYAITDTGSGFAVKWQHTPSQMSLARYPAIDADGHLLYIDSGYVVRINHHNGQVMSQSSVGGLHLRSALIATRDSMVILSDEVNQYMALSHDLQTVIWSYDSLSQIIYSHPSLSFNGTMIMSGKGTKIVAFRNSQPHPPVADFYASRYKILTGESVQFTDFSSYHPTTWEWYFEGGVPAASNSQNPTVTYNQTGIFRVELVVTNHLGSDTVVRYCYIEVAETMSAQSMNNDLSEQVLLYPNPVKDHLVIEGNDLTLGQRVRVTNLLGMQVLETVVDQFPYRMDFSRLPTATYILTLEQFPGKAWRIVKN